MSQVVLHNTCFNDQGVVRQYVDVARGRMNGNEGSVGRERVCYYLLVSLVGGVGWEQMVNEDTGIWSPNERDGG